MRAGPIVRRLSSPTGRRRDIRRVLCWFAGLVWLLTASANSRLTADDLPRLVRQLGSDRFDLRQEAQRTILDRWPEFGTDLSTLSLSPDPETLHRLGLLKTRIRGMQLQAALDELLAEPPQSATRGLPLWSMYSAMVGDDRPARLLYQQMLEQEPELLTLAAEQSPEYSAVLAWRLESLERSLLIGHIYPTEPLTSGKMAVLLLLSVDESQTPPAALASVLKQINPLPEESTDDEADLTEVAPSQQPMRRLLDVWVSTAYAIPAEVRLLKGVKYSLPSAVAPAREILLRSRPAVARRTGSPLPGVPPADPSIPTLSERKDALLALAYFGKIEHLRDVEPWLSDHTIVEDSRRRGITIRQAQLCDLALLAAVRIAGQDPSNFGFDALQLDRDQRYAPHSIGFETKEDRQAALRQWRDWQALHLRPELFDELDAIEGQTL